MMCLVVRMMWDEGSFIMVKALPSLCLMVKRMVRLPPSLMASASVRLSVRSTIGTVLPSQ